MVDTFKVISMARINNLHKSTQHFSPKNIMVHIQTYRIMNVNASESVKIMLQNVDDHSKLFSAA